MDEHAERRKTANRNNALASTGPRSNAGKSRSSMNAVKHGAYSSAILVLGESREDFESLLLEMRASLLPEGPLEHRVVDRIALLWWRLERAQRVERETLEQALAEARCEASDYLVGLSRSLHGGDHPPAPEKDAPSQTAFHWKDGVKIERLVRYEGQVERAFFRLVHELEHRQERRLKRLEGAMGAETEHLGFVSASADHPLDLGEVAEPHE